MTANIIRWLANGEVGESSKTMAFTALGEKTMFSSYPYDPSDFNRCLKLVKAAPEVRNFFPQIRALNPTWAALIDNWDELEALFLDEAGWDWSKARSAPKTYNRIQELRGVDDRITITIPTRPQKKKPTPTCRSKKP